MLARIGFILFALLVLGGLGRGPAWGDDAFTVEPMNDAIYVATQSTDIRALPSAQGRVLRELEADRSVLVTGRVKERDWYRVAIGDTVGYVSAAAVRREGAPEAPAQPQDSATMQPSPAPTGATQAPKPVGTFVRSHQESYDDNSGFFAWEDELVLNADGTADLTVKHEVHLRSDWYWSLRGCESATNYSSSPRVGSYRWKRKYTVTVEATTVSLQPLGPAEISWIDPICWKHGAGTGSDNPWVLDWVDGRLSDDDGDYVKKY